MERRKFLALSVVGIATISISSVGCSNNNPALNATLSRPQILSRLCDEKTVKEIGKAYLASTPKENNKDDLVNLLLMDSAGKSISKSSDKPVILSQLNKKVEEDFKSNRIVILKGWVLSVTEARQCALFSLT